MKATIGQRGIAPGERAPDFELPDVAGGTGRLSDHRGPIGSVEPLRALHAEFGRRLAFVDVLIRQAHPGPDVRAYRTLDDKLRDARRYVDAESIP